MSTIFESFSISHAAVLDSTGIEAQQLYGVREGSLSAKINSYSCLADDQEIMTWYDIESVAVAITNGYLSFDAIAALLDVAVSSSGAAPQDFYSIPWGVQHVPTGGPVALVLRTVAKDSTGTSPRMSDILLYQVSVHDLQLTGPSYKSGMGVTYAGTAMWSLQDETSTPLAQRQYGRLIGSPGVPGPVSSTLFGAAGQSGGIIQTADAVAQGAGSVVAIPAVNLTQAQGAGSVASPDVTQKAGGTATGKGAANVGSVLPVLVTGAGSVAATGKIAGVASPHGAGSVASPHSILKVTAAAQGLGSVVAAGTVSGGGPPGKVLFGASLGPVPSASADITTWISTMNRKMLVRHYFAEHTIWGSYAATPFNKEAGVRRILIDFEPAKDGSDANALDTLLGSCAQAGLDMDVTIYHAAPSKGFANPAAFFKSLEFYIPIVTKHGFRHIFDLTGFQLVPDNNLPAWYPGGSVHVDAIGIEYYDPGFKSGQRLDDGAAFADSHGVAFGLSEYGMNGTASGGGTCTEQEGLNMLTYVYNFYAARIAAKKRCYDVVTWHNITGNTQPGYVITNEPTSWITGTTIGGTFFPGFRQLADLLATATVA